VTTAAHDHQRDRPEAKPRPRQLAPVPPPRHPADAKPTPERPRIAEPMPVRDAIAECVAELVDQAPELSPRIADKLIRIITGHQH
jgi:hypothetical protein